MKEILQFLTDRVEILGWHVPMAVLVFAGLLAVSALLRNAWPGILGGVMLVVVSFLPSYY